MTEEDDQIRLLTLLLDRRFEHLALEEPDLLEVGGKLAEQGYIRCGGGRPIRDENGRLRDILNAEITAQGRKFLEEKRALRPFHYWRLKNYGMLRVLLSLLGLAIIIFLALLNRAR